MKDVMSAVLRDLRNNWYCAYSPYIGVPILYYANELELGNRNLTPMKLCKYP